MRNIRKDKIEITEMFMAQASRDKCYYGCLIRSKDANGNPHLFSRIIINDGLIQACASEQRILGNILDDICKMVLNEGLHKISGVTIKILDEDVFLN